MHSSQSQSKGQYLKVQVQAKLDIQKKKVFEMTTLNNLQSFKFWFNYYNV